MGYHHCPIEPNDWSYGPDEYDYGTEECRACEGTGEVSDDSGGERTCSSCDGTGFVESNYFDDDMI